MILFYSSLLLGFLYLNKFVASYERNYEVSITDFNNSGFCKGFILGDKWAITTKKCIETLNIRKPLEIKINDQILLIDKIVFSDGRSLPAKLNYMDLALVKISKGRFLDITGMNIIYISPDLPAVDEILSIGNVKQKIISYENCEKLYGYKLGIFCVESNSTLIYGNAITDNNFLSGIITNTTLSPYVLSMSLTYATNWIIDVMSEYVPI